MSDSDRIPPGQTQTLKFPVLHVGEIPVFDPATWTLEIKGLVERPVIWSWDEFMALSQTDSTSDFHCVTHWSRLDNVWSGVLFTKVAEIVGVKPEAAHVVLGDKGMYTTNIALDVCLDDDVLFAHSHDGEALTPEHGAPLRLVIPKRYAWKSCKWVRTVEFVAENQPGFWEVRGYSDTALPWEDGRFR